MTDAKDKLVLVQEETVNLKALQDKVAEVEKFLAETKTEYTKESMKALKDALADAKAILADPKNAKQADVDNALKTLTKAKEGLVPVTSDSKGTEAAKQEAKAPVTGRSFVCGNHAFGIYALSCGRNDRVCKEKTHLGLVNRHKYDRLQKL